MCDSLPNGSTIRSGSFVDIGLRTSMEDEHIRIDNLYSRLGRLSRWPTPTAFFGVFDGYGGPDAAEYIKTNATSIFFNNAADLLGAIEADVVLLNHDKVLLEAIKDFIRRAFLSADLALYNNVSKTSGTTAITALILGRRLFVANVGDCRAVLSKKGKAIDMSQDHKPIYAPEYARVKKSGGRIDGKYLNGKLAVSRSLGDWDMKNPQGSDSPLIAEPEIKSELLTEDDEFLIIACDGIWEALSSQQAVSRVRCGLKRHDDPGECAKDLVKKANRLHTYDNLTVIVVCFSRIREQSPNEQRKFGCFSL